MKNYQKKGSFFFYIALWITLIGLLAFIIELFLLGFSIRDNYPAYIGVITEIFLLSGIVMLLRKTS